MLVTRIPFQYEFRGRDLAERPLKEHLLGTDFCQRIENRVSNASREKARTSRGVMLLYASYLDNVAAMVLDDANSKIKIGTDLGREHLCPKVA